MKHVEDVKVESPYLGRVLIVDDKFSEVGPIALALAERGIAVQYWNGQAPLPASIRNVRVVILDLDLAEGSGGRDAGDAFYALPAKALNQIPGPFLVVIVSVDFQTGDPKNLEKQYKNFFGSPIHGIVSSKGMTKEEVETPGRLAKLVIEEVGSRKAFDLLLHWEGVIDNARDLALRDLVAIDVDCCIVALVKSIHESLGTGSVSASVTRELIGILTRLASRRVEEGAYLEKLDDLVKSLNSQPWPTSPNRNQMYNRTQFLSPRAGEPAWTGDICKKADEKSFDNYGIVLTPVCDFAQNKADSILLCLGFPLDERLFQDPKYPPYIRDYHLKEKLEKALATGSSNAKGSAVPDHIVSYLKARYLDPNSESPPPVRFHVTRNLIEDNAKEPFAVCFDLNKVASVGRDELLKWKRIARLDSPYIDNMLQRYGALAFRIGTPEWK